MLTLGYFCDIKKLLNTINLGAGIWGYNGDFSNTLSISNINRGVAEQQSPVCRKYFTHRKPLRWSASEIFTLPQPRRQTTVPSMFCNLLRITLAAEKLYCWLSPPLWLRRPTKRFGISLLSSPASAPMKSRATIFSCRERYFCCVDSFWNNAKM